MGQRDGQPVSSSLISGWALLPSAHRQPSPYPNLRPKCRHDRHRTPFQTTGSIWTPQCLHGTPANTTTRLAVGDRGTSKSSIVISVRSRITTGTQRAFPSIAAVLRACRGRGSHVGSTWFPPNASNQSRILVKTGCFRSPPPPPGLARPCEFLQPIVRTSECEQV